MSKIQPLLRYYLQPVVDADKAKKRRDQEIEKIEKKAEAKRRKEFEEREKERVKQELMDAKKKRDIAEEQRALTELRRQKEERQQKILEEERNARFAAQRKQSFEPKKKSPGKTIPLFGLFGTGFEFNPRTSPSPSLQIARSSKIPRTGLKKAPKGVPTIVDWKENPDKTITGYVHGSLSFEEGQVIVTSPIVGNPAGGSVVQTSSGSR